MGQNALFGLRQNAPQGGVLPQPKEGGHFAPWGGGGGGGGGEGA